MTDEKAFTVMEIMIYLAITALIVAVGASSFVSFSRKEALEADVTALSSGLRDARARTLASIDGNQHGIFVEADGYVLFQGSLYDPAAASNLSYDFSRQTAASSTISTVVFQRLTGNSTASGTIDVYLLSDPSVKRTIMISPTGLVSIE